MAEDPSPGKGEGAIDISRKLYVFHAVTDLLIVADLAIAANAAVPRRA